METQTNVDGFYGIEKNHEFMIILKTSLIFLINNSKMDNKKLFCKNDRSCTFLDLFLFILDGIVNFVDFYYEQYITPNVLLTIREETPNKFKLSFKQEHSYLKRKKSYTSCELIFHLEYDRKQKKVNFIEDTYKNNDFYIKKMINKNYEYEIGGTYDCNSFMCFKETFQYFLVLFEKCKKLHMDIDYNSKRFNLEQHYCEAEKEKIINKLQRIARYLPQKHIRRDMRPTRH